MITNCMYTKLFFLYILTVVSYHKSGHVFFDRVVPIEIQVINNEAIIYSELWTMIC